MSEISSFLGNWNQYSRVSPEMWDKAKAKWQKTVLRVNVFVEDYSVEIQTVAIVVAGVILTDRIVRSNQSVKNELRWLRNDVADTNRSLLGLHNEVTFFNDDLAAARWYDKNEKEGLKNLIKKAKDDGEPFEYYPGLGVLFPPKKDDK